MSQSGSSSASSSASKPSAKNKAAGTEIPARKEVLDRICGRAHYLATQMIWLANNRDDKEKGDPKIGGHPAASASSLHILGALHLVVKTGFDFIANKPHASPADHSYNYLLDLFLKDDLSRLSLEECNTAMHGLRKFSQNGEPVFQSYHSAYDSDHHGFLPSGTVGIPPVNAGYLALAYKFCSEHGFEVPRAHFWSMLGDSEFREGSVYEAMPDFAERELNNLTWIIDYNRQSLDGHRITNKEIMRGTDDLRIERTAIANGWDVIQVRHGHKRLELFKRPGGELFKAWLEQDLQDYELQALLLVHDMPALRRGIEKAHSKLKPFLSSVSDTELFWALRDLGGHDIISMSEAMFKAKRSERRPTLIIAHTVKGWGLRSAAAPGNHSSLPTQDEVDALRDAQGLDADRLFARLDKSTEEGAYCVRRGEELLGQIKEMRQLKERNLAHFAKRVRDNGEIPTSFGINLKMASYPHTQWMLGQCTAKLTRIANTSLEGGDKKSLPADELAWRVPSELFVTMAPDVGTSTNLNPAMDGKIFGVPVVADVETELGVKDRKLPDLVPGEEKSDRFIRFEIAEGNVMSCVGSYGKIRDYIGIPIVPLMTVYDFFIKRAHDQYFYNVYWKSAFILVGTPSGITLSPEGAQHGWKSDLQVPHQITWEPFFCLELDWILADSIRRHVLGDNEGRTGVVIRGVTRGVEQKMFLQFLKRQARFKSTMEQRLHPAGMPLPGAVDEATVASLGDDEILETIRHEVLAGAYHLVDYRGYAGYEPGDNVVNIFAMGSLGTEALKASEELLQRGIYANVIMVTSPDLLLGVQAHANDYSLLRDQLGVSGDVYITGESDEESSLPLDAAGMATVAGRRVPVVSVHDGEPGLLDNIGSLVGVRQEALAVRKHSKCGRPAEIFAYHHLDASSIVEACGKVLSETALERIRVAPSVLADLGVETSSTGADSDWKRLWPKLSSARQH
jgi:pyruvate dehydrogenase E1 component